MSSPLQGLAPERLWSHFDAIRQVPRPSKHEEQIAAHVEGWAKTRGFEVRKDKTGSLAIKVPATPGHEKAPIVILQGHLDMVCEKNSDVAVDFLKDPIQVKVEGDWVKAVGTTLGADNGVGVAAAMAVADDPEVVHGPIEILCTVDEETGLTGAKALDGSILAGRIMLNLDTEEDGAVYIGCAGGGDTVTVLPITRRLGLLRSVPVKISVRGLKGGHSGVNIHENRGNAVRLATRILARAVEKGIELDLVSLDGGSKHNAIPREAFAVCRVGKGERETLQQVIDACLVDFKGEFGAIEPDAEVVVEPLEDDEARSRVLNQHARDRLLHLLRSLPHGVLSMSRDVPGLVETSNNLAVAVTEQDKVRITTSYRSSVMPALFSVRELIRSASRQAGAEVHEDEPYPGWKPNPSSPIVQKTVEVYEKLFGAKPAIKAIHAGLECGLLLDKLPGLDVCSIGPEVQNAHSPDEKVQISSVQKFYTHLKALLKELA
jgi:dipeptidase D